MCSGPSHLLILTKTEGTEDVVTAWQNFLGPCDPDVARREHPESLWAQYGTEMPFTAVHGSRDRMPTESWPCSSPASSFQIKTWKPHKTSHGHLCDHGFEDVSECLEDSEYTTLKTVKLTLCGPSAGTEAQTMAGPVEAALHL